MEMKEVNTTDARKKAEAFVASVPSKKIRVQTFDEAVQRAADLICAEMAGNEHFLVPGAYARGQAVFLGRKAGKEFAESLVPLSEREPFAFNALRSFAANAIENNEELPLKVSQWLAAFLKDTNAPPKGEAGRGSEIFKHLLIYNAVNDCCERGFRATRNDASNAHSACDAVAAALSGLAMQPSTFEGVKAVWLAMRKSLRALKDERHLPTFLRR